ncbi:MAG TPA: DUF6797 domain-containing protein, partial [Verrucomicrobiae bacterium]
MKNPRHILLAAHSRTLQLVAAGMSRLKIPSEIAVRSKPTYFGYVFSARASLPLPVRNERGEGRGEGHPTADTSAPLQARRPSSPQPSPPSAGREGEVPRALNAYDVRYLLNGLLALSCSSIAALALTSSVLGQEPENQKESDWVDARWNQTDLGNFHASIVPLPNGTVAKGLSVRVGEHGEAAVVYDTASLILRAGWTGGFLKFNGSRYGLIRSPEPAGAIQFVAPATPPVKAPANRWGALQVHGPRVLATYRLNGAQIEETPWWESTNGLSVFTRAISAAPCREPLEFFLLETKGRTLKTVNRDDAKFITLSGPTNMIAVATLGRGAAELRCEGDVLKLVL